MTGTAVEPGVGLELMEVTVRYGPTVALDRVDLRVGAGETVAVVGPSGSGKSTLLRAVAGLEPLDSGRILLGGADLAPVAVHQRDLGLMFQDHALFPHLDVGANVAFGLRMKKWSRPERERRVGELLDLVGLDGHRHRAVHELSGGEAQRVALIRALAPEPGLLMLDEPFGSLDRVLRDELTVELRSLLDRLGQTALHVTHDQSEAFALADRVAVMRDGRIVQFDRPAELWNRPASAFVARFVGQPNVLQADLDAGGVVRVAGLELGCRTDLDPGRRQLMVPVSAIGLGDPVGERGVPAVVTGARFQDGHYRISARLGTGDGTGDGSDQVIVELDSPERLISGAAVRLEVVIGAAFPLDEEAAQPRTMTGVGSSL